MQTRANERTGRVEERSPVLPPVTLFALQIEPAPRMAKESTPPIFGESYDSRISDSPEKADVRSRRNRPPYRSRGPPKLLRGFSSRPSFEHIPLSAQIGRVRAISHVLLLPTDFPSYQCQRIIEHRLPIYP